MKNTRLKSCSMVRIDISRDCHESKIRCSLLCVPASWKHRQIWGRIVKSGSTRHDFHAEKNEIFPSDISVGLQISQSVRATNGLRPGPMPRARKRSATPSSEADLMRGGTLKASVLLFMAPAKYVRGGRKAGVPSTFQV